MKKILLIIMQIGVLISYAQNKAELIIHAPVLAHDDILELHLQADRIGNAQLTQYTTTEATNNKGEFHFFIDNLDDHTWASLNLDFQKTGVLLYFSLLDEFLFMEGDSVHIYLSPKKGSYRPSDGGYDGSIPMLMDNWEAEFKGRGAVKMELQWKIRALSENVRKTELLKSVTETYPTNYFALLYKLEEEALLLVEQYKAEIDSNSYAIIRKQVLGEFGYTIGRMLEVEYFFFKREGGVGRRFQIELEKFLVRGKADLGNVKDDAIQAPKYMDYLSKYTRVAFYNEKPENWDVEVYYVFAKTFLKPSVVRDRILARVLLENFMYNPQKKLLDEALSIINDTYSLYHLEKLKSLIKGTPAYDFSLPDVDGKYHNAENYSGKVVFMDFWYAACGPCKSYMKSVVGPVKEHFRNNPNVVFITVSTDSYQTFSSMVNKADFLPEGAINLYTDDEGFKHPIIKHYGITGYPYPLLIDRSGELVAMGSELKTVESLVNHITKASLK